MKLYIRIGILTKAKDSKTASENSTELERLQLAVQDALLNETRTLNTSNLSTAIDREFGSGTFNSKVTTNASNWTYAGKYRNYTINSNGTITIGEQVDNGGETETNPTFTIDSASYQFEQGMTWAQWVASSYNTTNYRIDGSTTGNGVVVRSDSTDTVKNVPTKTTFDGGTLTIQKALASDTISDGGSYGISNVTLPTYWYLSNDGEYTTASSEADLVTALSNNAQIVHCPDGTYNTSEDYEAAHPTISLITFTIDGTSYQAEEGMTWEEWCDSSYSKVEYIIYEGRVFDKVSGCELFYGVKLQAYNQYPQEGYSYRWFASGALN